MKQKMDVNNEEEEWSMLIYLTENEGISCVTVGCASENKVSKRVFGKAGMKLIRTGKDGLAVEDRVYDKMIYEFRSYR